LRFSALHLVIRAFALGIIAPEAPTSSEAMSSGSGGGIPHAVKVKFKVWLEGENGALLGEGGVELLRAIQETGSLKEAAKRLNYSYSFAWRYLRKLENRLGFRLVRTLRGGKVGGAAELTDEALRLLEIYTLAEETVRRVVERINLAVAENSL